MSTKNPPPGTFRANFRGIGQVMRSDEVRGPMRKEADGVVGRGRAIAQAAGATDFADALTVEESTRRGRDKRPEARVIADIDTGEETEFGSDRQEKLRILGRAANVNVR